MNLRFIYTILLLFFTVNLFCQDVLFKKDSTKTQAKILEVRPIEIRYKLYDYPDGPLYIASKKELAYAIYSNGTSDVFNHNEHQADEIKTDTLYIFPKPKDTLKTRDYIKFNIQLGTVIHNSYSNLNRRQPGLSHTSETTYLPENDKKYNGNINVGVNFLFGSNRYIQHVVGINYLRSKGEFKYSYDYYYQYNYSEEFHYVSKADFINIVTGLRFNIGEKFHIEPLVAFNFLAHSDVRYSGVIIDNSSGTRKVEYVSNKKIENPERRFISHTFSLCPKITYDFSYDRRFEAYASYNLAYQYELPWIMLGITYYPFKKLSPRIHVKKIRQNNGTKTQTKLFSGLKLNIDIAAVFNRGFTNTHENYSGIKPSDPTKYKTGCSLGANFYHGKATYFKHYVSACYLQSEADLFRKTYSYTYGTSNAYRDEVISTTNYNSKVCFANFGTGFRLTAFKHLNFDNGIALNMPLYSLNIIQHTETTNRYDNNSVLITSTSSPTEKTRSKEIFVENTSWLFMSKISYDFNIKQSKFGLFYGWNFGWKNNSQWHMLGMTYYPFKKLR